MLINPFSNELAKRPDPFPKNTSNMLCFPGRIFVSYCNSIVRYSSVILAYRSFSVEFDKWILVIRYIYFLRIFHLASNQCNKKTWPKYILSDYANKCFVGIMYLNFIVTCLDWLIKFVIYGEIHICLDYKYIILMIKSNMIFTS